VEGKMELIWLLSELKSNSFLRESAVSHQDRFNAFSLFTLEGMNEMHQHYVINFDMGER
jgi:hypothetical protein